MLIHVVARRALVAVLFVVLGASRASAQFDFAGSCAPLATEDVQNDSVPVDYLGLALTDEGGSGILASGLPLLSVSAWPYTMQDLEAATHTSELPRRDTITLNLDYRQTGVGGDDGWGARPHAEYTLEPKPYSYSFRLRAYAPGMGALDEVARQVLPRP